MVRATDAQFLSIDCARGTRANGADGGFAIPFFSLRYEGREPLRVELDSSQFAS
jgi:hypothetical protein